MNDIVIQVKGISKRYRIGLREKGAKTFAQQLWKAVKSPIDNLRRLVSLSRFKSEDASVFWALKDINFSVERGEIVGIVGHNGAGKSTLLKILSQITEPTTGEILIRGRVSSLLEVGTGFHPELTGRENVYMNGTIHGMSKKEIDEKFDEILAFSGVEKHIDTPVKFYSSGMKVRLGFSVAAHLEPDILIIDEVLAVGDAEFQKKCLSKMNEVAKSGRTILFVSHDMAAVNSLCTHGIYLKNGRVDYSGTVEETIKYYFTVDRENDSLEERKDRQGTSKLKFISIELINSKGEDTKVVESGESIKIKLGYRTNSRIDISNLLFSLNLYDASTDGLVSHLASDELGLSKTFALTNEGFIYYNIKSLPLRGGSYYISIYSAEVDYNGFGGTQLDSIQRAFEFDVLPVDYWNTGKLNRKKGVLIDATITS